jgi:hypothetical protein
MEKGSLWFRVNLGERGRQYNAIRPKKIFINFFVKDKSSDKAFRAYADEKFKACKFWCSELTLLTPKSPTSKTMIRSGKVVYWAKRSLG